jgi:hypothetical protein
MTTITEKKKTLNSNFDQDYNLIVKNVETTYSNHLEWIKKGDVFTKCTLYKEYTPVKTSCNTTLFETV